MAENDPDHTMATFHVETFSPNQVPADSNKFGDMYPSIANTQNPSNLPHGVVEIPKVTLDDMIPVDENDFIEFSVPKRAHPFDNSYSTYPRDLQTFLVHANNLQVTSTQSTTLVPQQSKIPSPKLTYTTKA